MNTKTSRLAVLIAALLAIASAAPCVAATYYVAALTSGATLTGNGSNSNNGTDPSTPFATLAKAASVVANGDTILLSGESPFRSINGTGHINFKPSGVMQNVTIGPIPSTGTPVITGATALLASSISAAGTTDIYTTTLATGLTVTGVQYKYYATTKSSAPCIGARGGYLNPQTPATGVDGWWYNASTGVLTFSVSGLGTTIPADGDVEYEAIDTSSSGNYLNAITFSGGSPATTSCTVTGISFDRIGAFNNDGLNGYGVLFSGGATGCTVNGCTFYDCNDHGCGFLSNGGATTNSNNLVSNCWASGSTSRSPDSCYVWFTDGSGNVSGAKATNSTAQLHGPYTRTWTLVKPVPSSQWSGGAYGGSFWSWSGGVYGSGTGGGVFTGFYGHCSFPTATGKFSDVQVTGCAVDIDPNHFLGDGAGGSGGGHGWPLRAYDYYFEGTTGLSGSPLDPTSYPIRFVQCTTTKGMGLVWSATNYTSFDRCYLQHDAALTNNDFSVNVSGGNTGLFAMSNGAGGTNSSEQYAQKCILFSGCVITANASVTGGQGHAVFTFATNNQKTDAQLYLLKCTVIDNSPGSDGGYAPGMIAYPYGLGSATTGQIGPKIHAYKTIFVAPNAASGYYFVTSTSDPTATQLRSFLDFSECGIYGLGGTNMAASGDSTVTSYVLNTTTNGSSPTTDSLRKPAIWTAAIDYAAVFTNPSVDATTGVPASGSWAITTQLSKAYAATLGINNRPGQNAGAYQYGAVWYRSFGSGGGVSPRRRKRQTANHQHRPGSPRASRKATT